MGSKAIKQNTHIVEFNKNLSKTFLNIVNVLKNNPSKQSERRPS